MILGKIVTYSEIYGRGSELPKTTDLTKGIPSPVLIHYFSFINSKNFLKPYDLNTEKWILKQILFRFEGNEREFLLHKYGDAILRSRSQLVTFFPLKSILNCLINEFENPLEGKMQELTKEQEINILKRVLVQNEITDRELVINVGKLEWDDPLAVYRFIWSVYFPNSEFYERKKIYFALFKAINFLEFLESFEKFKPYLPEFLKTYSVDSSLDYIKNILLLLKNAQTENNKEFTSYFHSNYDELNPLTKELILQFNSLSKTNKNDLIDFKILRKTPIIKFDDGTFAVTNWNFVIDKFYPAIIYHFFNKTKVKNLYKNKAGEIKINNYLADIGKDFAEQQLLYNILSKLIDRKDIFLQFGDNQTKTFDLYIRIDRHILLIEFKNISLPKKETFEEIKELIDTKFILEGNDKKGVLQLVDQIKKFAANPESFENYNKNGVNKNRLIIYPIIIYTDNSLNMYGVNSYLNNVLRTKIKKMEPKLRFRVQDLVFISYDFFLDSYDIFSREKIDLIFLLNYYYSSLFKLRKKTIQKRTNPINLHATFEDIVKPYMVKFPTYKNEQFFHGIMKRRLFKNSVTNKSSSSTLDTKSSNGQ